MTAVVGVLVGRSPESRYSVHRGYVDALWELGATPVLLTPSPGDPQRVLDAVARMDAVLLTGGGDVDPRRYGGPAPDDADTQADADACVALMELDDDRDETELACARWALDSGRRILGICRGTQVLAVAAGGRLVRDLPEAGFTGHWQEERQYEPVHGLDVELGTLAAASLGGADHVNSIHHQSVAEAGSLRVTARSTDGVIEAIEADDVLGVQWHPERLLRDPRHLAAFRWLVGAA